jgi:hypothetical protein
LGEIRSAIVKRIDAAPDSFVEDDLDWIVPQLIDQLSDQLRPIARYAYGATGADGDGPIEAFKAEVVETVRRACEYYLFRSEHWRSDDNRSIGPYIIRCARTHAEEIQNEVNATKRINLPTCPACRTFGQKWFVKNEEGLLHCDRCKEKIEYLQSQDGKREAQQGHQEAADVPSLSAHG